jgi:hypothetical protein
MGALRTADCGPVAPGAREFGGPQPAARSPQPA